MGGNGLPSVLFQCFSAAWVAMRCEEVNLQIIGGRIIPLILRQNIGTKISSRPGSNGIPFFGSCVPLRSLILQESETWMARDLCSVATGMEWKRHQTDMQQMITSSRWTVPKVHCLERVKALEGNLNYRKIPQKHLPLGHCQSSKDKLVRRVSPTLRK